VKKSKSAVKTYLYRILETDKRGKQRRHLAEVQSDCDENARRKIIHTVFAEGGSVQVIDPTDDRTRLPGDTAKRHYG
jgi:hypothetical protein